MSASSNRNKGFGTLTRLWAERSRRHGSIPATGNIFNSVPKRSDRLRVSAIPSTEKKLPGREAVRFRFKGLKVS